MSFYFNRLQLWILWTSMALASPVLATTATGLPAACDVAIPLLPTDADRDPGGSIGETRCYRLDLPAAGLLHLDLSIAGTSASRARLAVAIEDGALATLTRSATEWLARAGAGAHLLLVGAEDPLQPLPPFRLSSRFVTLEKSDTDGDPDPDPVIRACLNAGPRKSDTDGELEPDPDPFTSVGPYVGRRKSDTDGELEPDPDPLMIPSPPTARRALCSTVDGDDHGDSFACATPIHDRALGELANGWGDDVDVFRFQLCDWRTVEITTTGDADTFGELFDRAGQRLAGDDDGGDGGNFRLVRSLGPGAYFVRVEGVRSAGAYALAVRGIDH
jgi:hypothetical protein